MSGSEVGRAPRTDAEWARDITARVRKLEQPASLRVGPWVLFENAGDLIATRPGADALNLTATPGEQTPVDLSNLVTTDEANALIGSAVTSSYTDLYQSLAGLLTPEQALDPLTQFLQTELGKIQQLADAIFQGITGFFHVDTLLEDIVDALGNIPFLNILGIGGPSNIGDTIQSTWDRLISGFVGILGGNGAGLADLFNVGHDVSSRATLGSWAWGLLGIRTNKSLDSGLLATSDSTYRMPISGAAAPMINVTATTAINGFKRFAESIPLGVVSWLGSGTTNISDMRINIWKMDTTTGQMDRVHASANIIGSVHPSLGWNIYDIPSPIAVVASEVYSAEIEVRTGSGTHQVVGTNTWLPNHPTTYPKNLASVRNPGGSAPPASIIPANVQYATNVPWIEFAIEGGTGGDVYEDYVQQLTGDVDVPVPSWCNFIDAVPLGGGGGGRSGGTLGFSGEGGDAGHWQNTTWARGTHFDGDISVTSAIGAGGHGGQGVGGAGGTTTVSIPGHSLSAAGGGGGDALNLAGADKNGAGPGTHTYLDRPYQGGGTQSNYGGDGAYPGGGGAGGNWLTFSDGGDGAAGTVFIVFRQV